MNATITRKQQEIVNREKDILRIARKMIVDDGYHGLNMDRIAAILEYSKGTIYNHFRNKEEIVISLAIETAERRTRMFSLAAAFRGSTRERIMAIAHAADAFFLESSDYWKFEEILRSSSVWEKTTEDRRKVMLGCEIRCMEIVGGIARDAVACGDLTLPESMTPEELVFGMWSLKSGAYNIITTAQSLRQIGVEKPMQAIGQHINAMLDGYQWRPLSSEMDLNELHERISTEVTFDGRQ